MANIPVEHKSGGGWWKWLLALLVVALLIWLLMAWLGDDDEEVYEVEETQEIGSILPEDRSRDGVLMFAIARSAGGSPTTGGTAWLV